jgi:predicted ATPase
LSAQLDLIERYQRERVAHGYQADAAQQAAIGRLQVLRTRWLAEGSAGFWSRLRRWLWTHPPDGARSGDTRGLYLRQLAHGRAPPQPFSSFHALGT